MARKIRSKTTLDAVEHEILFTRSAIKADPNAEYLLEKTDAWEGQLEPVRALDKTVSTLDAEVRSSRGIINRYLDKLCRRFGDELFVAVERNTQSTRWTTFFKTSVSTFLEQPFADQVSAVRTWLGAEGDDVLEKYRKELESWVTRAEKLFDEEETLTTYRNRLWQAREELTSGLTKARDALDRDLADRAVELGFERSWHKLFFVTGR